nr:MAG TPA: glutathione synthase [Caudoviricetes sp.]
MGCLIGFLRMDNLNIIKFNISTAVKCPSDGSDIAAKGNFPCGF